MHFLKLLGMIGSITFCSRILGFIRDTVIVRFFGADTTTDAFFIAFKLPNLLRKIFAEGAFSQTFIPILSDYKNKKNKKTLKNFIANVSGLLILILVVIVFLGIFFSSFLIQIIAPGFSQNKEKFILACLLLKITFPYILFISLTSLASSILYTWNYFFIPTITPIFLNISMIFFCLFTTSYFNIPILALAWSVIFGGILQTMYQMFFLKKINMLILPTLNLKNIAVWNLIKKMGTITFGISVYQISLILNTIFASFLVSGSISWMYYADRLIEFPSGILGVTLSTILLPSLSKAFYEKKKISI